MKIITKIRFLSLLVFLLILVTLTSAEEKPELIPQRQPSHLIFSVNFSPDGKFLASSNSQGEVEIWEVKTGRLWHSFKADLEPFSLVYSVRFTPDMKYIVGGGIWDLKSKKQLRENEECKRVIESISQNYATVDYLPGGSTSSLKIGKDNKYIAVANVNEVNILNVDSGKVIKSLKGYDKRSEIYSMSISPDGKYLATGSVREAVEIWDIDSGELCKNIEKYEYMCNSTYSSDGKFIVMNSSRKVNIWRTDNSKKMFEFTEKESNILRTELSPSGKYLILENEGGKAKVFEISTGKIIQTFNGYYADISNNEMYVALYIGNNTTEVREIDTGVLVRAIKIPLEIIHYDYDLSFSSNGKYYAIGNHSSGVSISIYEFANDKIICNLKSDEMCDGYTQFLRFKKKFFGVGSPHPGQGSGPHRFSLIWEINSRKLIQPEDKYNLTLAKILGFAPKYLSLYTGGDTSEIRDLVTDKLLLTTFGKGFEWVSFTPEGYYNCSENGEKLIAWRVGMDLFGPEKYRDIYYKPDIINKILQQDYPAEKSK